MKNKKFAIILSGCGGIDGSEIHEAVCLMIAIKLANCDYMCFALNENQKYVFKANKMEQCNEARNMLIEASRLNHGKVYDLNKLNIDKFDALILPGGYGMATSYSNFIICENNTCRKNINYNVKKEISNIINEFHKKQKPIFAGCIAPNLVNRCFSGITLATDENFFNKEILEKMGNKFKICKAGDVCVDKKNKIVSVSFYMTPKVEIDTIFEESVKAVKEIIKLCK